MTKKKKMTLRTLEKTMKKKTMTSRFQPGRRRPQPWNFGTKTRNNKNTTLGVLEKTMKNKTMTLRFWLEKRRP
jgi:hypothetical protein